MKLQGQAQETPAGTRPSEISPVEARNLDYLAAKTLLGVGID